MRVWYTILYCIVWPFFNLFHPGKAIGRENIPQGGALVCGNHTRMSDPFFMIFAFHLEHQLRPMAKAEVMRVPFIGWLLKKVGVFGVERGKSDVTAIKHAMRLLKNGEKVVIFPEGTRHKDGESGDAKKGAAMLAVRMGVPIVPVYIPAEKKWFRRTPVVIGEPYVPKTAEKKATAEEYQAIADDLIARIQALSSLAV